MGGAGSNKEPGDGTGDPGSEGSESEGKGNKKMIRPKVQPVGKPWTEYEINKVRTLAKAGFTALEISRATGRNAGGVYALSRRSDFRLDGDRAKETRLWLQRGLLVNRDRDEFGAVFWRHSEHQHITFFYAPYLEKLLELGWLTLMDPDTKTYGLKHG